MTINIFAQPMEFDSTISGAMPNINVIADSLIFTVSLRSIVSSFPPAQRDSTLDWTYDCLGLSASIQRDQGVLIFGSGIVDGNIQGIDVSGNWLNKTIWEDNLLAFSPEIFGNLFIGNVFSVNPLLSFIPEISGRVIITLSHSSWVKWSKIGRVDFTIDHSNQAGERLMEWSGFIHDIIKKDNHVVIYGSSGISIMKPKGRFWEYKTLSKIGTAGRQAQISNSTFTQHWFIDSYGYLYEFSDQIRRLDYHEYLSQLIQPVLSLNEKDHLLYICDGSLGYIYSYRDKSLGITSNNITGYGINSGSALVVAPADIVFPAIGFITDIYDCGNRKEKTIFNLEINTNVSQQMEACIYYRKNHAEPFQQTPWNIFTSRGICYLPCYGIEFKFGFRMLTAAELSIDQFKINGVIHGFSFLDTVRKEN